MGGISRATLVKADDGPNLQEVEVRVRGQEHWTSVEHWLGYGLSVVPLPPDDKGQAEALIGYIGGSPDHPIVIGVADRRHRPKNLKPGDAALHDHRGQSTVLSEKGTTHTSPLVITHNTVDKNGAVTSSVTQDPSGKVTITTKGGATIVMDGPNITTKPGAGGKHVMDGDLDVKGSVTATATVAGQSVTSGGQAVRTA